MPEDFVEGWTAAIKYQLLKDGAPFSGVGMTPSIVARDKDYVAVNLTGTVSWDDVAQSIVSYAPSAADILVLLQSGSPYYIRFKVRDGANKDTFFPKGIWERWVVRQS